MSSKVCGGSIHVWIIGSIQPIAARPVQMSAVANREEQLAEQAARGRGDRMQGKRTHDAIAQDETDVQNAPKCKMLNATMLRSSLRVMQCQIAQYVNHAGRTRAQESTK